jgi:hypothetical protein
MVGGIEQLIILLLGAFAVTLVITLASEPWKYPERTPILALFVAVIALLWSGVNTFFTLFYHPEDLRVYIRFPKPLQLGTNTLDINYFFSNMGNQAVLIEDVSMDEIVLNSTNKAGAELRRCDEVGLYGQSLLSIEKSEQIREEHLFLSISGAVLNPLKPAKIYIDGAETSSSSTTVEAGKMKAIGATFETERVPSAFNTVVICPVIRFFDSKGQPVLAVCRGWQSGPISNGPPAGASPARLLPAQSMGLCRTLRPAQRSEEIPLRNSKGWQRP